LYYVSTGIGNTGIGTTAGGGITTGSYNTFLGDSTGLGITTGNYNTILGAKVIGLSSSLSNNIILSDGAGNIRMQFNSSGNPNLSAVPSGVGTKALRIDGSGNVTYADTTTGGSTPNLQEVLTAGSTLTGDNTVTNTGHTFKISNTTERLSLADSAWFIGNERAYVKSNNVGNKLHIKTSETTTDTSSYKLLVGKLSDGESAYMSSYPVVNDASKMDTLQTYGTVISTDFPGASTPSGLDNTGYVISNGATVTGGTGYFNNYIATTLPSASLNYSSKLEFSLTTKPTASTEGIWLGRLSYNSFTRSSIAARAVYVDATHWTINLYAISGFSTETLVASTAVYTPASIDMTNGANYRIDINFNSPNIRVDFSRIDTTLEPYQDVIENCFINYSYTTVIGDNPQIPNTGGYGFGAIGSSPAGVYVVHLFQTSLNSFKNTDFAVVGNSIATGYNSSNPENTFTNRIFSGTGRTYSVFAGPSDRTDEVLLRMGEIFNSNPTYVLLEIGWNDIGASSGSALFSANLTRVIDTLQGAGIIPIVLRLPQTASGYDTAFVNVCNRENVKLIDVSGTLIGSLDAFDIHPNDRGNMIIANLVRLKCPEIFGAPNPTLLDNNSNILSKTITGNTTAEIGINKYYIDATTGNVTLTLYPADVATVGNIITVVRTDASGNTVTIARGGSNTINGTTSVTIGTQYETLIISGISSTAWVSSEISVTSSGVTTMGAIGATPNANGATISGSTLNLEPASASFGGVVTTGTQTIAGNKNLTGTTTLATPFTLGATSVTSTGTQLNLLNAATGTTGTTSTNLVYSASPTFTGTVAAGVIAMTENATITKSQAAATGLTISNTSASVGAEAKIGMTTNAGNNTFGAYSTATSYQFIGAGMMYLYNDYSSGGVALMALGASSTIRFGNGTTEGMRLTANRLYIGGGTTATAKVHIAASTTGASSGQIKLAEGSDLTTPEDGNINYVSNNLKFTEGSTVYTLAKTLTNTATLDFGSTAAGAAADLTITVTGAAVGDAVYIGVDNASVSADNIGFWGWVSSSNTVTVRFNNNNLVTAVDPASGTFRAVVTKY